ncbi:isochorismatase family protein [Lactococcus hircilactis]|uniref:Isochorismatase family protein n=2 Tax=Lactococcus hircilactis TaxID=1494462 RepID=A0A7X1Z828_9LACT|nr:cysteine hydrolase family protein [Lactococcus hircilactis]MQW38462.1 isochorismatase family protein [Lactococcus hircilactis]
MLADAFLMIDMQNGVLQEGSQPIYQREKLIEAIDLRLKLYRKQQLPVIVVQHEDEGLIFGTKAWEIIPEIKLSKEDFFVRKTHANAFYQTTLQDILNQLKVKSIEFAGAQTDYCINASVEFAFGLGYENVMMRGLSSTYDNPFLSAEKTIAFFEQLWENRFLKLID